MLTQQQVEQFRENGFLKGGKVLADDQVEELREEVARVIRDKDNAAVPQPVLLRNISREPAAQTWQIVNIWRASKAFERLISSSAVVNEVAQLMAARELRIFHDQIQYKPASTGAAVPWHQDSIYWTFLTPKDVMVTAWVALDDVDEDNGCMRMVPRSHRWGNQQKYLHSIKDFYQMPGEFEGKPVEVTRAPVAKGHVHYHHALTWHGSGQNRSGRPRRAIALHYITEQCRYDANSDMHPMKPFVEVADGEVLKGKSFPLVWSSPEGAAVG